MSEKSTASNSGNPAIHLLLVDHQALFRQGLVRLFDESSGCEVVGEAGDQATAITLAQHTAPDVILMDFNLPGNNGLQLIASLRRAAPQAAIILVTAMDDADILHQAALMGVMGIVYKEESFEILLKAIQKVSSGEAWVSRQMVSNLLTSIQRGETPTQDPFGSLSKREYEILLQVLQGKSSARIGEILHLSPKTVESYRSRMMQKLGVSDLASLIKLSIRYGVIPLE